MLSITKYKQGENVALVRLSDKYWLSLSVTQWLGGQLLQRWDGERIRRVAWKIVRGLH